MSADTSSKWNENQFDLERWPEPDPPTLEDFRRAFVSIGRQYSKILVAAGESLSKSISKIGRAFLSEGSEPRYRENKPHCMAPDPGTFHYDRRGRKRY